MIVSHDDSDHSGGALSVLQALPVADVLSSLPDLDPLILLATQEQRCQAGQHWMWDGVRFDILYPDAASYEERRIKSNDRGCVLKISTVNGTAMIPADIERRGERMLLEHAAAVLRAEVLIAPHHGSRTSSSAAFVAAVAPQVVIYPVGYRNAFRHPHPDVVARYQTLGSTQYRTDEGGAIRFELGGAQALAVSRYRDHYKRYWHAPRQGGVTDGPLAGFW